jgi:hypothetical protein
VPCQVETSVADLGTYDITIYALSEIESYHWKGTAIDAVRFRTTWPEGWELVSATVCTGIVVEGSLEEPGDVVINRFECLEAEEWGVQPVARLRFECTEPGEFRLGHLSDGREMGLRNCGTEDEWWMDWSTEHVNVGTFCGSVPAFPCDSCRPRLSTSFYSEPIDRLLGQGVTVIDTVETSAIGGGCSVYCGGLGPCFGDIYLDVPWAEVQGYWEEGFRGFWEVVIRTEGLTSGVYEDLLLAYGACCWDNCQPIRIEVDEAIAVPGSLPSRLSWRVISPARYTIEVRVDGGNGDRINLSLYDVSGRQVRETQIHELRGTGTLGWDGPVEPGVYFLRLATVDGSAVERVVVAR